MSNKKLPEFAWLKQNKSLFLGHHKRSPVPSRRGWWSASQGPTAGNTSYEPFLSQKEFNPGKWGLIELLGGLVYYFSRAAMTKYQRQGSFNKRNLFFTVLEVRRLRTRWCVGDFLWGHSPWLVDGCFSLCLHMVVFWSMHICVLISSSYKDSSWWPHFTLITLFKTLSPNVPHILRYRGLGLQHRNFEGDTQFKS